MAKTFAIKVEEIHAETFLVDAETLEEAIEKVNKVNDEVGFELDEITDFNIEVSPLANEDGTATDNQMQWHGWLYVESEKYLYNITLDGKVVGNQGDGSFDTREEAIENARDYIESDLINEYNRPFNDFKIEWYVGKVVE